MHRSIFARERHHRRTAQARAVPWRDRAREKSVLLAALALLLCLSLLSAPVLATVVHTLGVARDGRDDSVRYIEHHQYLADGSHRVDYYSPGLDLLAYKRLTYPGLPQHPRIIQADLQTGVQVEVTPDEGTLVMRKTTADSADSTTFPLSESIVVDAGFDQYIRAHWDTLTSGEKARVDFAVAGAGRLLPVEIRLEEVRDGNAWFRVQAANWLMRALVPEILIAYDSQRRLTAYRGFSNLRAEPGDSKMVTIEFNHYELDGALESPLQDWLPAPLALAP